MARERLISKCSLQWKPSSENSIRMVVIVFFLLTLTRSSSTLDTTSTTQDVKSAQITTEDPMVVLRKQLDEVAKQREAARQQEAEDRRKEAKMREEEKNLREFEAKLQQADVDKKREEAEKQQGTSKKPDSQNQSQEPKKPIESVNSTVEVVEKKDDLEADEKRQETATQLIAQKYLRGQKRNETLISELLNQCQVQNCFSKVIKQAVEKILQKMKVTTLIKTERKLNVPVEESTYVYRFVSDKVPKKDYATWTELAIRVKEIMTVKASANITAELKRIRDSKVPNKIKNLIFPTKVCIRNIKYNEFLYAVGSPELWYDDNRRHVFTRLGGSRNDTGESGEFTWKVESINGTNEFFIVNRKHNEYLFVDNFKWGEENRFAFTWTDDGPVTRNIWQIILNSEGRYFEIKNVSNNEYLFADYDRIFNGTMRCAFTHSSGTNNAEGYWDFINCSSEK